MGNCCSSENKDEEEIIALQKNFDNKRFNILFNKQRTYFIYCQMENNFVLLTKKQLEDNFDKYNK